MNPTWALTKFLPFKPPQVIGNLDKVDRTKEENMVFLQIQVLEEYKKMISYEKKRRSMGNVVQEKKRFADFKAQLKTKRRSDRVTNPYQSYQGNQADGCSFAREQLIMLLELYS